MAGISSTMATSAVVQLVERGTCEALCYPVIATGLQ